MLKKTIIYWVLLTAGFLHCINNAQCQGTNIVSFNSIASVIYDCVQDKRGFLWLATNQGILRFDGIGYKKISIEEGISDNEVLKLCYDEVNDRLWFCPFAKNIQYYNIQEDKVHSLPPDNVINNMSSNGVVEIQNSVRGGVYIYYKQLNNLIFLRDGNVFIFPGISNCISVFEYNSNSIFLSVPHKVLITDSLGKVRKMIPGKKVIFLRNNHIVFETEKKTNGESTTIETAELRNDSIVFESKYTFKDEVSKVAEDDNYLYFSFLNGGVSRVDYLLPGENEKLFTGTLINKILIDKKENVWFLSYRGGIYCRLNSKVQVVNMANGVPNQSVEYVYPFNKGTMLISSGNYLGVAYLNDTGLRYKTLIKIDETESAIVHQIQETEENKYLLTTNAGFIKCISDIKSQKMFAEKITEGDAAYKHSAISWFNDDILIASGVGCYLMNKRTNAIKKIYQGRTTACCISADHQYWAGSITGLLHYNKESGKMIPYPYYQKILNQKITFLASGTDSLLWIGTSREGVYILKGNMLVGNLSPEDVLHGSVCNHIFVDNKQKKVWVSTENGLSEVSYFFRDSKFTYSARYFNTSIGLPSNYINSCAVFNDTVFAATAKGLAFFPATLNEQTDTLVITNIRIGKKEYPLRNAYTLKPAQNNIVISFNNICYTCFDEVIYKYKLLKDKDTIQVWKSTRNPGVEFGSLLPGSYRFILDAGNGKQIEIDFYIEEYFWKSLWFISLCVIILISLSYFLYWNKLKKEREKASITNQLHTLEIELLQSQINPHFIFNTLNSINQYVLNHAPEMASSYIKSFSNFMRMFLESTVNKYISLSDELVLLDSYLHLEKMRFNNSFSYIVDVEPGIDIHYEIPCAMIHPFVENAIKHGINHRHDENGIVRIQIFKDDNILNVNIEDNGPGADAQTKNKAKYPSHRKSRGIELIRKRLAILKERDGVNIDINIVDIKNMGTGRQGTLVKIQIEEQQ